MKTRPDRRAVTSAKGAKEKPAAEPAKPAEQGGGESKDAPVGVLQWITGDLKFWVLVLGLGLGSVGIGAAYLGLFLLASTLVSIFLVAITLYAFLRYWPDVEERSEPKPKEAASTEKEAETPKRQPVVSVVRLDGPPRARMMLALKEIARRQDNYKISKQGAERFAKVIRYLLKNDPSAGPGR